MADDEDDRHYVAPEEGQSAIANALYALGTTTYRQTSRGVAATRRAVTSLPNPIARVNLDRLAGNVPRVRLSRLWRQRGVAEDTVERDGSDTEDQVQTMADLRQRVEGKYFDPAFDATREELVALSAYPTDSTDEHRQLAHLDGLSREREVRFRAVSSVLQRRLLEDYGGFVAGVAHINAINGDLVDAADDCTNSRRRVATLRAGLVQRSLRIPALRRRRDNLRAVVKLLEAVAVAKSRAAQVRQLLTERRFKELVDVAKEPYLPAAEAAMAVRVVAVKPLVEEWEAFRRQGLLRVADTAVEQSLTKQFHLENYSGALEAYLAMQDQDTGIRNVANTLYRLAVTVVPRCVSELSSTPSEDAATAARGVGHPLACVLQLCARALDVVVVFRMAQDCHEEGAAESPFHASLAEATAAISAKVGTVIHEQLIGVARSLRLPSDVAQALHLLYLLSLLVEGTAELGIPAKNMAAAREALKQAAKGWVSSEILLSRCAQLVEAMRMDYWVADPAVKPSGFSVVTSHSPSSFRRDVKSVRHYVAQRLPSADTNPFYDLRFTQPADLQDISVEPFAADPSRSVLTSSAALVGNTTFLLSCGAVARYPPLANELFDWVFRLVALYIYVTAANFVGASRTTQLEDQNDFPADVRALLAKMRQAALQAVPHLAGAHQFPPVAYEAIQDRFGERRHLFTVVERLTAVEAAVPLLDFALASLRSVRPLLAKSTFEAQCAHIVAVRGCVEAVLHVGAHRLASAVAPCDWLTEQLAAFRWESHGGQPSSTSRALAKRLQELRTALTSCTPFPSAHLQRTMERHIAFALQCAVVAGIAKVKRRGDGTVAAMQVETQALQHEMAAVYGGDSFALPDHVTSLLRAFFLDDTARAKWLQEHHEAYRREDLVAWLSDRDRAAGTDAMLAQLRHDDHVIVGPFLDGSPVSAT